MDENMSIKDNEHASRPTLAILDWGIGGMGFYNLFKEKYPYVAVCYFSDSGSTPYGKQRKGQLVQRLGIITDYLRIQGVTHMVVACNAMSTILPYWLLEEKNRDFHITGVILPTLSAAINCEGEKIGVVGGRRTILSRAYLKPLKKTPRQILQRIAQPISAFIEKGEIDTPLFQTALKK
jgi:glutamate racemase